MSQEGQSKKVCAVLLASYNGEQYLEQQLSSIKAQIGWDSVIYYSDDGSDDNTLSILRDFNCVDLNEKVVKFGGSAANFLSAICKYKVKDNEQYIFLSDQDDIWFPNKMSSAIKEMKTNGCSAYSGSFVQFNQKKVTFSYVNKSFTQNSIDYMFRSPGPGFTFGFSKQAFQKIQSLIVQDISKFENVRWHDWLIYTLARNEQIKWYIDPLPYTLYRLHDRNDTGQPTSINMLLSRLRFVISGKFGEQVRIMASISNSCEVSLSLQRMNFRDRVFLISSIPKMRSKFFDRLALLIWIIFERKSNVD